MERNLRRGNTDVRLFEIGYVFRRDPKAPAVPTLPGGVRPSDEDLARLDQGLPEQRLHVAALLTGRAQEDGWLKDSRDVDWTDAVESARRVLDRLGADYRLEQPSAEQVPDQWHPGRTARLVLDDGTLVGMVGELHPRVDQALGFPAHSAAFELSLDMVLDHLDYTPLQAKPVSMQNRWPSQSPSAPRTAP